MLKFAKNAAVDLGNAINYKHHLNKGRVGWWIGPYGGGAVPDLYNRANTTAVGVVSLSDKIRLQGTGHLISSRQPTTSAALSMGATVTPRHAAFNFDSFFMSNGVDSGGAPGLGIRSSGTYALLYGGIAWHNLPVTPVVGRKVRLMATKDASVTRVYLNGNLIYSSGGSGFAPISTFSIGSQGSSRRWVGDIEDVVFWDRLLSPSEVATEYRHSTTNYESSDSPLNKSSRIAYSLPLLSTVEKKTYSGRNTLAITSFGRKSVDVGNAVNLDVSYNRFRILWLRNQDSGGLIKDLIPGGKTKPVAVGTPSWTNTNRGTFGISFPGSDSSYISLQRNLESLGVSTANAVTVTWWQRPRTSFNTGTVRGIWGCGNGTPEFSCQVFRDNNWYAGFASAGQQHRVQIPATAANWTTNIWSWYALTCLRDGVSILYQNGKEIGRNSGTTTFQNPTSSFVFGRQALEVVSSNFNGDIEGLSMFTQNFSREQIQKLYEFETSRYEISNSPLQLSNLTARSLSLALTEIKTYGARTKLTLAPSSSFDVGSLPDLSQPINKGRVAWYLSHKSNGSRLVNAIPGGMFPGTLNLAQTWQPTGLGDYGVLNTADGANIPLSGSLNAFEATFCLAVRPSQTIGAYAGLIFSRPQVTGLLTNGLGELTVAWNGQLLSWMTGVTIPVNEFSLLWGSISPTGATVLRYSRAGRWHNTTTNTNAPHLIQDFVIGADTYDPVGRQVKGLLANGSIWNRALTLQEMVEESARYFQGYKVPYSSIRLLQRPVYFPFPGSAGGGGGTGRIPRLISPTRRRLIGVS